MSLIQQMAGQIFNYVTKYLPWGFIDTGHGSTIDVIKTDNGLRVITTDKGVDGTGYREITVDIPQSEITNLMNK